MNGLSYDNRPSKFIFMSLLVSFFSGLLMFWSIRSSSQNYYAWVVMKITFPIVCLVNYNLESPSPTIAGYRLLNIAVGMLIELLVTTLVFPRDSRSISMYRTQDILKELAGISREACHLMFEDSVTLSIRDVSSDLKNTSKRSSIKSSKSRVIRKVAVGGYYIKLRPLGAECGTHINHLGPIEKIMRYEDELQNKFRWIWNTRKNPLLRPDVIERLRRTFRQQLNALLTLAYLRDSLGQDDSLALYPFRNELEYILEVVVPKCLSSLSYLLETENATHMCIQDMTQLKTELDTLITDIDNEPPGTYDSFADFMYVCAVLNTIVAVITCIVDTYVCMNDPDMDNSKMGEM